MRCANSATGHYVSLVIFTFYSSARTEDPELIFQFLAFLAKRSFCKTAGSKVFVVFVQVFKTVELQPFWQTVKPSPFCNSFRFVAALTFWPLVFTQLPFPLNRTPETKRALAFLLLSNGATPVGVGIGVVAPVVDVVAAAGEGQVPIMFHGAVNAPLPIVVMSVSTISQPLKAIKMPKMPEVRILI